MQHRIETSSEKILLGNRMQMSFSQNKTADLWRGFMPRRSEIKSMGADLYSVEVYPEDFFRNFSHDRNFEKWAAVEVKDVENVPAGMEQLVLPSGKYAVFVHKGPASEGPKTYGYIFNEWLPSSGYALDNRPHFALMGQKYKHEQADSEEEIWIPII